MAKSGIALLALATLLSVSSLSARAGTIDSLYVFGDSLSDAGNIFAATGMPAPPYYNGQFSNGPVWAVDLASALGLPALTPSLLPGGTDYAYGTGEVGNASFDTSDPRTDLLGPMGQLAQFKATHATADPNALYVIWLGSNDLADIPGGSTPLQIATDIGTLAGGIDSAINALASQGAKNFLVVTVPDLGKTPAAIAAGPLDEAGASALSAAFDSELVFGGGPLPSLASIATVDGLNLKVLDTYSLLDTIVGAPSAFGFANVTQPCLVGSTACADPSKYLFWDTQHPTAAGQALVADGALALVAPTPEPAPITMVGAGLLGLALILRSARGREWAMSARTRRRG